MKEAEHAAAEAEVFLVVGTSAVVYPAAGLIPFAKQSGAKVIEINLEETPFSSSADCSLRGKAAELLPRLPFPDPGLTLGEARVLARGRAALGGGRIEWRRE